MEISIIIPVYNSASYLRVCLDSVFAQAYGDFEVICINDGSTDESLSILEKYGEAFPNLSIYTIENSGQANARNYGIGKAKGKYVTFVDSDDTVNVNLLKELHHSIIKENADLAFCDINRIQKGHKKSRYQYDTRLSLEGCVTIYSHPEIICYLHGAPYGKLVKRSYLEKNEISFVSGFIYEDQAFTQLLLSYNPKIVQVKEKLYEYYVHPNSTMTSKASKITDMYVIYDYIYQAYVKQGINESFSKELQFLCLYHVLVGTSFRLWRSKQASLFESISLCRMFVRKYKCKNRNPYLKEKGWITKIFVFLFA